MDARHTDPKDLRLLRIRRQFMEFEKKIKAIEEKVQKNSEKKTVQSHGMPWLHGKISRKEAEELFMPMENGLFLIRESNTHQGDYVLSVCCDSRVAHYRVRCTRDSKFTINSSDTFENLTKLVEHYQEDADGLCTKLEKALEKKRDFRSLESQDTDFKRTAMPSGSQEFQASKTLFHRTIPPQKALITSIEKINNEFLRERYERKREQVTKKLKKSNYTSIEKQLFHGTTAEVIDAICKHNFDHRLHGKHGTKYGAGSYFAVNASYSYHYSRGETRFMFLAHVLTGEYKLGNETLRRPPLKDPCNPASDLFDSCVDNEDNPSIFVVFNDEQCYPSYLITYTAL